MNKVDHWTDQNQWKERGPIPISAWLFYGIYYYPVK